MASAGQLIGGQLGRGQGTLLLLLPLLMGGLTIKPIEQSRVEKDWQNCSLEPPLPPDWPTANQEAEGGKGLSSLQAAHLLLGSGSASFGCSQNLVWE